MQIGGAAFPPHSRLFVVCGRLVTNDELDKLFSPFGTVASVRIALDRSNKSRGFAFVQYAKAAEAAAAIEALHGAHLHGHTFKVSLAHASSPKGKKKDVLLPSGKRARDDKGEKPSHASKRMGSQTSQVDEDAEDAATTAIVQSVLTDMVQHVVDHVAASSKSSLKRKDSDAGVRAPWSKRQPATKVPKRPAPPPKTSGPFPPRAKLFVTSVYEYTHQELHAMFHVYGDFDHVQMVHCQGKLHTMAYVQYTKMSTATFVLDSFADDRSLLSVTLADEIKQTSRIMLNWIQVAFTMPTPLLTSIVSQCAGMEFIDIPVASDTGAAKGRANIKFTNETLARAALAYLGAAAAAREIQTLQLIADPTSSYEVDIRAVESQFAHLMSTPYYPSTPPPPPSTTTDDDMWLHLTSDASFTWHDIQSVVTPVPVLDMVMDHDPPVVFEAWLQFASAKYALLAMNTLLQSCRFHVSVARQPPPSLRHTKKAKRLM
ncbi:Aste57867_15941 [Aphanomyces stellatus]|uniref:Aste57867_15941 protein n=1 Tax=Aphanomyces stellatus TaxID=120398 RepID=A0A485L594_9STRA|nr:hypothetical protein As57867_015885 [Aphanomyces stellatus]VFT92727.1 Aste57867_15941 [Aphanomyces stellatus]